MCYWVKANLKSPKNECLRFPHRTIVVQTKHQKSDFEGWGNISKLWHHKYFRSQPWSNLKFTCNVGNFNLAPVTKKTSCNTYLDGIFYVSLQLANRLAKKTSTDLFHGFCAAVFSWCTQKLGSWYCIITASQTLTSILTKTLRLTNRNTQLPSDRPFKNSVLPDGDESDYSKQHDKLIGGMLKQHVHHSLEGHSGKTSHLICNTQSYSCHKGKGGDTHSHTQFHKHTTKERLFIYFFKTDLCLLICPLRWEDPYWNNCPVAR